MPPIDDLALSAELDKLGAPDAAPEFDAAPKPKRKRSGTSGAERARRAKAAGGTSAPKTPRAPRSSSRRAAPKIADGMAQLYVMGGLAMSFVPSGPAVAGPLAGQATITGAAGQAMVANAQTLGGVWEQAAKDDPRIREAIEKLLTVSTLGVIVTAHMPIVLAGLCAAGAVPEAALAMMGGQPTPEAPAAP